MENMSSAAGRTSVRAPSLDARYLGSVRGNSTLSGGVVDDCIFYKPADDEFFVIVNASNTASALASSGTASTSRTPVDGRAVGAPCRVVRLSA